MAKQITGLTPQQARHLLEQMASAIDGPPCTFEDGESTLSNRESDDLALELAELAGVDEGELFWIRNFGRGY